MTIHMTLSLCLLLCFAAAAIAADFEAPPAPFQTVPRPAEGETVSANPPCLVYPATRVYEAYVVEVSKEPTFPVASTRRYTSSYMLVAPAEAMTPGRYYWRWRPGKPEEGANEWSCVRSFTVPASAPVVPFPDIDALAKRIGSSHPRVAVTAAELTEVRHRALKQFGGSWLAGVKKYAEQMRDKPVLPEPDFLPDAKDPKRIEIYQKTFQTTRPFMRELVTLAENYLLTGDELSGQEARRRLLHIIAWNPRGSTSLGHNDEPATEVVRYCPTAFDRVYPLLTEEERKKCLDCLIIRMNEVRDLWRRRPFEMYPYESHNMGYYLPDMLEACLALVGEAPVEEMLRYTMLQLWSPFYPPYGGADGGWCEGPSYWTWSTSVFANVYRLVEKATGVPVHLRSNVRNMPLYKLYGNPPYFQMSPFGDGQEGPAIGGHTMAMLAALYKDPYAQWYADRQNTRLSGLVGLLFGASQVKAKAPYDLPQGHAFYDIGLVAMHSVLPDPASNVALLFRSCPFGSISHAFADQNTFTLDVYGEPLIIASGYYQLYGHPHHARWTWQTKASNSVLVNGEGQSPRDWNAKGRLVTFKTTAAGDHAVGDATKAYPGKLDKYVRHVVFLRPIHTGGEPIIVIRDEIAAPKPSTYQFLLHALNKMEVATDSQRVTIARGASRCRVDYVAPQKLAFGQDDRFTVPPFRPSPNQWHLTASTAEPATATESLIVIQPYRSGGEKKLLAVQIEKQAGYVGVRLTGGDRTLLVIFQTDAEAAKTPSGKTVTDARAASLSFVGNPSRQPTLRSAVIFQGTRLQFGATALLQSEVLAAVSLSRYGKDGRLVSSDAPRGTHLAAELPAPRGGSRDTWVQGDRPFLKPIGSHGAVATKPLEIAGQPPVPLETTRYDWVQRLVARARVPGPVGHYEIQAVVTNTGDEELPVAIAAGSASLRHLLASRQKDVKILLPAADLGGDRQLTIAADEAFGGQLVLHSTAIKRVYGVNLIPNSSFEEVSDGRPVGWSPATITKNARSSLSSAEGGRNGGKCLKVTCTDATGGDFGAMLTWPGVAPSNVDRQFRMSCWVKTDDRSVAGLQVTSADWTWWNNTERLRGREEWTETALEFVLPAGQNLTHVRLHMNAEKTMAELFVDDVSLIELPPK